MEKQKNIKLTWIENLVRTRNDIKTAASISSGMAIYDTEWFKFVTDVSNTLGVEESIIARILYLAGVFDVFTVEGLSALFNAINVEIIDDKKR